MRLPFTFVQFRSCPSATARTLGQNMMPKDIMHTAAMETDAMSWRSAGSNSIRNTSGNTRADTTQIKVIAVEQNKTHY